MLVCFHDDMLDRILEAYGTVRESAWADLRTFAFRDPGPFGQDCELRRFGQRLAQSGGSGGKRRAVIAVARKLACLLLHLWRTGEVYEPWHRTEPPLAATA